MSVDVIVPEVGESITEVLIVEWLKSSGDPVEADEPIAVIETDKATLELPSPAAGHIGKLLKQKDEWAKVGEAIATIESGKGAGSKKQADKSDGKSEKAAKSAKPSDKSKARKTDAKATPDDKEQPSPSSPEKAEPKRRERESHVMPAAARLLAENDLDAADVEGTGPGGRILKEDVQRAIDGGKRGDSSGDGAGARRPVQRADTRTAEDLDPQRETETVPLSPLRRSVARRLVEAQQTAALLTTFNEIDMSEVMSLRKQHGEAFEKRYEVRLGFTSFFVKASIEALKEIPGVNARIEDNDIVYHNYYDIGIAVGGGKGLVVPVIRNAELKSFAEIEREVAELARRAKANQIELKELQGGTFTISNGGIYGSMLSTPIVNPPQSGILGLHAIQDRPVARSGEVVIRPMMYVALTYDHRLIDGREAVTFLRRVKEVIENPARMLLEI
jgi:2-oxoglutarate dehydrogenase E2 component (dihydrolipoamide succinyltransferase)